MAKPNVRDGRSDVAAGATQKIPSDQPITFVHDQFDRPTRHRHAASPVARIIRPIGWEPSGVAQASVRASPRASAAPSKIQISKPPAIQINSPSPTSPAPLQCDRIGPIRVRQPAMVERLAKS